MVDSVYIERGVHKHPRVQRIIAKYPKAKHILIDHYGEVFNAHKQNFRLQKRNPSLILAAKQNKRVLETPAQYETGGGAHYYFSHMLNCVYDCRYCFLQGMLRSANYLLFVNYEDFAQDLMAIARQHENDDKPTWFFSGYDCDSLAYEPVSQFARFFLQYGPQLPNSILELRTKSTQIRSLLESPAHDNVVVAYSLAPEAVAKSIEHGAPSLLKRLEALAKLQKHGWRIGLRFDPIIWYQSYLQDYEAMIESVFQHLDTELIDSVTLGGFRLPKPFYKNMRKLYPEHWMLYAGLCEQQGQVQYTQEIETAALRTVSEYCHRFMPKDKVFSYASYA